MARIVHESYFGEDVVAEARRFGDSAEFEAEAELMGLRSRTRPVRILDLGAGNGIASAALARMGHEVVALDPDLSPSVGLGAVRTAAAGLECVTLNACCGVAQSLPFRDASFDVVYARQTLHHVRNLSAGLAEARRVLKRGGLMLATREHVADDEAQLQAFLNHHPLHRLYGGEHAYRLDEYLEAARNAGLELCTVLGPYDSVINTYPKGDSDVRMEAMSYLSRKIGPVAARIMLSVPRVYRWYRARMSHFDRTPGRLYSFLWLRPDTSK